MCQWVCLQLLQGLVNASTQEWQLVEPVSIPLYREESYLDGPGYATLRYDERAIDLDDLTAPKDHVVTGVRLRKLGGHLNLVIGSSINRYSPISKLASRIFYKIWGLIYYLVGDSDCLESYRGQSFTGDNLSPA